MSTTYGINLKLTIYGGSHDDKIGVIMSGMPGGEKIDMDMLSSFMRRRAPGQNAYSTKRKESDIPVFLSGVENGITTGDTIEAVIYNENQRSGDYGELYDIPRPSHADFSARMKYGDKVDLRGGGHFSGRLTAPLCIAGGICLQFLSRRGIAVASHIYSIFDMCDIPFDPVNPQKDFDALRSNDFPVIDRNAGLMMCEKIEEARLDSDSVGGVIETAVTGLKPGLGEHMFCGVEGRIASVVFGVPAVKGIEFGLGFASSKLYGSQNNDPFYTDGDKIYTSTNNCGGILGGMSNGMPVIFRAAVKPTPSIGKEQDSVSLSRRENVKLKIGGRHDPCIVPRAVPVMEAAAAVALADILLDR